MKQGIKVSGLVGAGKVAPIPGILPSTKFEGPADDHHGKLIPGHEYTIRLAQLVDSPFQMRLVMNPARVDDMGQQLQSQGQIDAIEFRRGKEPDTYELIKGHTRKYGALSIGWTELRGIYRELTDAEADIACLVDNTGATPEEYEFALKFRHVLDMKYVNSQAEVGKMFGVSQSTVSKGLAMLSLPEPVQAILRKQPSLFGVRAAAVIQSLYSEYPSNGDIILEGIERLKDGMEQVELAKWVKAKINDVIRKAQGNARNEDLKQQNAARRSIIKSATGKECYVTILKEKSLVVEFKELGIPTELAQQAVNKALDDLAQKHQAKDGQ